ncbi:MAG: glycoside hydrolase family 16 protein [Polyangiaceae bacterium]
MCAATGCSSEDLSIGRQDPSGSDASVTFDAQVSSDVSIDSAVSDASLAADSPDGGKFVLVWRDDFDTLDPARWELAEHTFEENYADFSMANAVAEGGYLKIAVRVKPSGSGGKPYSAAEVRTWANVACGKFVVRARIAPAAGVASTFFAFHDFFQNAAAQDWNELVMEASSPSRIDYVYTLENASLPGGKERVPRTDSIGFNASQDFHTYGFEWTPTEVRFLVDGVAELTLPSDVAARLNRAKRVVMSAYPSTRLAPNRTFDPAGLPTEAWYDWIEVYRYTGSCPTAVDGGADAIPSGD